MARGTPIPSPVRALVLDRAGGRCEHCAAEVDHLELHHRVYRSRGGEHDAANLVALCGWGNHQGCHGIAHSGSAGTFAGLAVPSWEDPATTPLAYRGRWVLLGSAGEVVDLP